MDPEHPQPPEHATTADPAVVEPTRAQLRRQATSIAVALVPFGVAFGVLCAEAGLSWLEALGYSSLVFTGSAQFAAVGVLADGGTAVAAVGAGLLLNLRCIAFGVAMAPALRGRLPFRLLVSQVMIDESMAVGSGPTDPVLRRYGYLAGGLAVFVLWNASTVVGAVALGGAGDLVTTLGIDATIPAAFLALLWPRLSSQRQRRAALGGVLVALAVAPFVPAGAPILLAAVGVVAAGRRDARTGGSDGSGDATTGTSGHAGGRP